MRYTLFLLSIICFAFCSANTWAYYEESLNKGANSMPVEILQNDTGNRLPNSGVKEASLPPSPSANVQTMPVQNQKPEVKNQTTTASLPQNPPIISSPSNLGSVQQIGSGIPTTVSAKGSNMPLSMAMPLILPKGWQSIYTDHNLKKHIVTFNAKNSSFIDVLDSFCLQTGTNMKLDWNKKTVRIYGGGSYVPPPDTPRPVTHVIPTNTNAPVHPIANVPPTYSFDLKPGSMSKQLMQWCNYSGYQLIWKVEEDFELTANASFGLDFKIAVEKLLDRLQAMGTPLRGTLYESNHILEIVAE